MGNPLDRLMSMVVPKLTVSADVGILECRDRRWCTLCSTTRARLYTQRCCDPGGCGPVQDHGCGSC
jgi:hypothetical protein